MDNFVIEIDKSAKQNYVVCLLQNVYMLRSNANILVFYHHTMLNIRLTDKEKD